MEVKARKPNKKVFTNLHAKQEALVMVANGVPHEVVGDRFNVDQSCIAKLKAREKDRLEELKLELSNRVADKLLENTCNIIETANGLHKYIKDPDNNPNTTVLKDTQEVLQYLSHAGKTESEVRRSLGFSPSNTSMVLFQQNTTNNHTIDSSVLATLGKYISSELIDVDHTTE